MLAVCTTLPHAYQFLKSQTLPKSDTSQQVEKKFNFKSSALLQHRILQSAA